ncbi:GGDEF domain-containing protein [Marinagarivorans cellulosilyticus]|uniref:diguanylate cyclase n=1 Tax=Marinagarivorans cellulosilyticus TaxID=2721545 RepID=A0AAN2BKJ0_9GAMM|nr:GGDEF domain-containing protein [Marinagarivorans cellulosilyticus]BCD98133.1 hypothetical protein MARGE09_P2334 [Marinagarivorans cellulosilyticus]
MKRRFSIRSFYAIRLGVGILTVGCLLLANFMPQRSIQLFPSKRITIDAYADNLSGGNSVARWLDKSTHTFQCDFMAGADFRYCGASIKFFDFEPAETVVSRSENYDYQWMHTVDLSTYDALVLELDYQGQASGLRLFIRNAFSQPSNTNEHNAQKFIYQNLAKRELSNPITIPLSDLKVADWWVDQYRIERKDASVAVDSVFELGIDFSGQPPLGKHTISVKRIEAVGEWVSDASLYIFIIALWLASLAFEGGYRIFLLYVANRRFRHSLLELKDENSHLRLTARTDALTRIYNRAGLETLFNKLFPAKGHAEFTLVVIDLDHFKKVNDNYGHAAGDQALQVVSKTISQQLRSGDIFGRWGGEEFLLLTMATGVALVQLMHRLNIAVEATDVNLTAGDVLNVTMSMGATAARKGETLNQTFARADAALYNAKAAGRNTWRKK